MGPDLLTVLPSEILSLILAQLCLVRDIKKARACRALRGAAPAAEQAHRRMCLEHACPVTCVAVAPDGRVLTGPAGKTIKVWRDGACERTIQAHANHASWEKNRAVALLPGAAHFVSSGGCDGCGRSMALSSAPSKWTST